MAGPAHRSVANIRPSAGQSPGAPGSPHTPIRTISSTYGSPSSLRAEEDCVIIELGSRYVRAGFAGDSVPKAVIEFGPEQQRRAGDHRRWQTGHEAEWRKRVQGKEYGEVFELWRLDLRGADLGLMGDKIERAIREAYTKYLLIDSRPRRIALSLPSALPLPLLSTILDTLFNNFQPPTISLMSAPILTTVAAGLRAALVVDIGWAETLVTAVYEYREVQCCRTVRACKLLGREMMKLLGNAVDPTILQDHDKSPEEQEKIYRNTVSFEECEDIVTRMAWCRPSSTNATFSDALEGLPPVQEEDEIDAAMQGLGINNHVGTPISILLTSSQPSTTLHLPFSSLAEPCEKALFADGIGPVDLDDEEQPLHLLVYNSLLRLPVDVRSVCMSRIVFTGGGSLVPGLKQRILDEVKALILDRDWDPVQGKAVAQLRTNTKLRSNRNKQANDGPVEVPNIELNNNTVTQSTSERPAFEAQESDPIEDQIRREANKLGRSYIKGTLRAIESVGSWSGASILSQLKIPAVSIVEREQWQQHGLSGASKQGETMIINQRQSMGPAGLRAMAGGERSSWTLGPWG